MIHTPGFILLKHYKQTTYAISWQQTITFGSLQMICEKQLPSNYYFIVMATILDKSDFFFFNFQTSIIHDKFGYFFACDIDQNVTSLQTISPYDQNI